jgi:hypothetical protein
MKCALFNHARTHAVGLVVKTSRVGGVSCRMPRAIKLPLGSWQGGMPCLNYPCGKRATQWLLTSTYTLLQPWLQQCCGAYMMPHSIVSLHPNRSCHRFSIEADVLNSRVHPGQAKQHMAHRPQYYQTQ